MVLFSMFGFCVVCLVFVDYVWALFGLCVCALANFPPPSPPLGPTAAAVALTVRAPQAPRRVAPGPTAPAAVLHAAVFGPLGHRR